MKSEVSERVKAGFLTDLDMEIFTTDDGVEFVRTPDSFFKGLPCWPYEAIYVEINGKKVKQNYSFPIGYIDTLRYD